MKQMSNKNQTTSSSDEVKETRLIHVKIIGGSQADIYEIGKAMKHFSESLPYKLEALVTNDRVELQDVDTLIKELYKLKKHIDTEKRLSA